MQLSAIDRDLLIRTVVGEAANEPLQGQAAVAHTVLNRMRAGKYGGKDVQGVIFARGQFEPWSTRRGELMALSPESQSYQRAAAVVDLVLNDQAEDPTSGGTHFLNESIVRRRRGGSLPEWAQGEGQAIGQHTFYAPEGRVQTAQAVTDPAVLQEFGLGVRSQRRDSVLRPFDPAMDRPRANDDGSFSTEITRTVQTPDGWANVPSLWFNDSGPQDFGYLNDDQLSEFAQQYERQTGERFPRFQSIGEAERVARERSARGGATRERLAAPVRQPVTDPQVLRAFDIEPAEPSAPIYGQPEQPILPGREIGVGASFRAGFASNQAEELRNAAATLYPNEPIEEAMKRFGQRTSASGEPIMFHRADDGQLYRLYPRGMSLGGVANDLAYGVGQSLPPAASALVGMATAPMAATGLGLAGSIGLTGGATGAAEYARQRLGDVMMGEAADQRIDPLRVASEAAFGTIGQGIGGGTVAGRTRFNVRDLSQFDPQSSRQAYQEAQRFGIDITPAEATGLPTLGAQQKRLTNLTATANTMREFLDARDGQVLRSWQNMLDSISPYADAENIGMLARDTAESAFADMRRELRQLAAPYYTAAYMRDVQMTPALEDLTERPVMRSALQRAQMLARNEGAAFNPASPDVRGWDYVKRALDDIMQSPAAQNQRTGGRTNYGRIVNDIRQQVLREVDAQVPEYAQARALYSTGAEDITNAMQSALRTLADTQDVNVLRAARQVFDPNTRSPQMVLSLRRELESRNPDAWQALKRLYMQDVTRSALRVSEQGAVLNPAGKIHRAFMDPYTQANLRAAMTQDEWNTMRDLLIVFRRASSAPALRSDTEFNRLMTEEAISQARPLLAKITRVVNPAQALRSADEFLTNRAMDQHADAVVQLVTRRDPEALAAMRELRRLSPWDRRWTVIFGHLLTRSGAAGVDWLALPDQPDFEPAR